MLRLTLAIKKMLFCFQITNGIGSFVKLLWNTKKSTWGRHPIASLLVEEPGAQYNLTFNKKNTPVWLRTQSGDLPIFYEIFWAEVYHLPREYSNTIKTIIDLGANTGLASLYFHYNFPQAIIYCIEPDPGNFDQLLQNLKPGITEGHIVALKAAIDNTDGEASLIISPLRYNSRISPFIEGSENMVKTIAMITLMKANGLTTIDLLKIDIEGSEQRLFENDTDWLYAVKHIFIEFHSPLIKQFCLQVLLSKNFSLYPVANRTGNTLLYRALNNNPT